MHWAKVAPLAFLAFSTTTHLSSADADTFCSERLGDILDSINDVSGGNDAVQQGVAALGSGVDVANENAEKLVQKLQDFRGENLFLEMLEDAAAGGEIGFDQEIAVEYAQTLIPFAGPSIALAVLTLLSCPFCLLCSRRCCCRKGLDAEDYSTLQKMLPITFYLLFAVIAVALSIVSISNVGSFVDGLVGTLCEFDNLGDGLQIFFDGVTEPLENISAITNDVLDEVAVKVNQTHDIEAALASLQVEVDELSTYVSEVSLPSGYSSTFLDNSAAQISAASQQISDESEPVVDTLQTTRNEINSNIVNAKDILNSTLVMALEMVDGIFVIKDDFEGMIDDVKVEADKYLDTVSLATFCFFSTVYLSFIAGLFILISSFSPWKCDSYISRPVLSISFICSYLFMLLLFLLSGVFLPVSLVMSDVCVVVDTLPTNFSYYLEPLISFDGDSYGTDDMYSSSLSNSSEFGEFDAFDLLEGCFATPSVPVLESLGMADQFDFASIFDAFSSGPENLTASLDFSGLDQLTTDVAALDRTNFGLEQSDIEAILNALNTYADGTFTGSGSFVNYTLADCTVTSGCDRACLETTTCAPISEHGVANANDLEALRNATLDVAVAVVTVDDIIANLNAHVSDISASQNAFLSTVADFENSIADIENDVQPLIQQVSTIGSLGNCSFVAETYYGIHEELCDNALSPLIVLALLMFFIALCGIPLIITSLYIDQRLFGRSRTGATVWADSGK